jgi:hypothetical protein
MIKSALKTSLPLREYFKVSKYYKVFGDKYESSYDKLMINNIKESAIIT